MIVVSPDGWPDNDRCRHDHNRSMRNRGTGKREAARRHTSNNDRENEFVCHITLLMTYGTRSLPEIDAHGRIFR